MSTVETAASAAQTTANGKWTAVDASVSQKGIVKLNTSTSSTSTTEAATPSAVKAAKDAADNAQTTATEASTAAASAQAAANTANGARVTAGQKAGSTLGSYATADGYNNTASGYAAHASGSGTTASGYYSNASGYCTTASGKYSFAAGCGTNTYGGPEHMLDTCASGDYSFVEGHCTSASNYASHAMGKLNKAMTNGAGERASAGDVLVIGNGKYGMPIADGGLNCSLSNCFRVTYAGEVYALSAFNATGADYAEYFEWADGNPEQEDRVGYFVTADGNKIRKANAGEEVIGIVSGNPSVIGNADEDWRKRWIRDDFGRPVKEYMDGDGNVLPEGETSEYWNWKENPAYDPNTKYIERKNRPEWSAVGLIGVLAVRDDGTCIVGGRCNVTDGGIGTRSDTGWRVLKRISPNVVSILFHP